MVLTPTYHCSKLKLFTNCYLNPLSVLLSAPREGEGVPKNGAKVLKYCQKALEVSTLLYHTGDIYRSKTNFTNHLFHCLSSLEVYS